MAQACGHVPLRRCRSKLHPMLWGGTTAREFRGGRGRDQQPKRHHPNSVQVVFAKSTGVPQPCTRRERQESSGGRGAEAWAAGRRGEGRRGLGGSCSAVFAALEIAPRERLAEHTSQMVNARSPRLGHRCCLCTEQHLLPAVPTRRYARHAARAADRARLAHGLLPLRLSPRHGHCRCRPHRCCPQCPPAAVSMAAARALHVAGPPPQRAAATAASPTARGLPPRQRLATLQAAPQLSRQHRTPTHPTTQSRRLQCRCRRRRSHLHRRRCCCHCRRCRYQSGAASTRHAALRTLGSRARCAAAQKRPPPLADHTCPDGGARRGGGTG
eukprot:355515-Chlamydomonas_euryale.AAC.26